MQIHLAGVPGGGSAGHCTRERELNSLFKKRLWSYYWLVKHSGKMAKENKVDLFLDSGAFSAWSQGITIDIQEYIQFIKEHRDVINIYANLDVIGLGGKQPNKLTAEKTLENQNIMEAAGLIPLPCFHFGEPLSYLEYYVKNYNYLALGVAGNSGMKLVPWLDECFSKYICDDAGMPKIKIHGFAVTSLPLMLRYPWYSVDSISWVFTAGMGSVYVPKKRGGKYVYNINSWVIAVSNRKSSIKEAGAHINTMPVGEKQIILDYFTKKGYSLGKSEFKMVSQTYELKDNERWIGAMPKDKTIEHKVEIIVEPGLSNKYQLRNELNIIYFQDLEKFIPEWPWKFTLKKQQNFF